ncbi:single-stranded-DNA-specific exonuclease RecJ [Aquifex pyrophilus]
MRGVSGRKWELLYEHVKPPEELERKYGKILAQLLANRGFEKEAELILEPKLSSIPSLKELGGVEEAVERILRAVKKKERIIIYGDYDVDGITGTAILYKILKKVGAKVIPVLPDRNTGYGLNENLMKVFERYGNLLITVDNGTSAVREIDRSSIDTIVVDHHNIPDEIPKKAILINPKLGASEGLKYLSSSAVVFFLAAGLIRELNIDEDPRSFLDLVALGLLADYMPLKRVNRILSYKGLKLLEFVARGKVNKAGVRALLEIALRGRENISSKDVYFSLAPRLNAAGRISKPDIALNLLVEEDERKARSLALQLDQINKKRQYLTRITYAEALEKAEKHKEDSFIVVWDENWHPGILGIVAGRLSHHFGKPVAVFSKGRNKSVGSIRSTEEIEVYDRVKTLSHMFLKWGGHDKAMGLTLPTQRLEEFREKVNALFREVERAQLITPVDMELSPEKINEETLKAIRKLEPFGEGNPEPIFITTVKKVELSPKGLLINGVRFSFHEKELLPYLKKGKRILYKLQNGMPVLEDIENGIL